jgi:hypothetical protein
MALRGQSLPRFIEAQTRFDLLTCSVFALYNRNRTLIKTLGVLFALEQLAIAGSNVVTIIPHILFSEDGCYPLNLPDPVAGFVCARISPLSSCR